MNHEKGFSYLTWAAIVASMALLAVICISKYQPRRDISNDGIQAVDHPSAANRDRKSVV